MSAFSPQRFGPALPPWAVVALCFAMLSGCAFPLATLTETRTVTTPGGTITVRSAPGSKSDADEVERALNAAAPKLARWGALDHPVDLYLMPTHADLERTVRRYGYDWLRAWAQYDDVLLQTPSTWARADADVAELLSHELTHCLMYQRSGTPGTWATKDIPLWFREGMATWTAEQGLRWMTLEDLAQVYAQGPGHDPILDAEAMYQSSSAAVYAAAHYAFTFLHHRYGREGVERVLSAMAAGAQFDDAFRIGIGIAPVAFVNEFRRYVTWRAFRGNGRPLRPPKRFIVPAPTPEPAAGAADPSPPRPAAARSPAAASPARP